MSIASKDLHVPGCGTTLLERSCKDGPGSVPKGDHIFRQFRPALARSEPILKWVLFLSRG